MKVSIRFLYGNKFDKRHSFLVFADEPHIQSQANLLLLKEHYKTLDHSLNRNMPKENRVWLTFRNKVLKRIKKLKGELTCFYCGQKGLFANINSPFATKDKKATLDHYVPKSRGGRRFDESNLRVCCFNCNQIKADLLPDEFYTSPSYSKIKKYA